VRETSVYCGGNAETDDFQMALFENDEVSESVRNAPDVGILALPGIKCSLVHQSEAMPPPKPENVNPQFEADAAESSANGQGESELGPGPTEEEAKPQGAATAEGESSQVADNPSPSLEATETFNESRVAGTETYVFIKSMLKVRSSEETMERVARSPPQLARTLVKLLDLVRPISFS